MFEVLKPDIAGLPTSAVLATLVVVAILETTLVIGIFLPGEVIIAAGIGVLPIAWSPAAGLLVAGGCLVGQVIGYLIGRRFGPALRHSWIGRRTGQHWWDQAEQLVQRSGGWLLVSARFIAIAHTLAPVLAGTLKMPLRKFILFATLSSVAWSVVWTTVGIVLGRAGKTIDQGLLSAILVVGGIVVAGIVVSRLLRHPVDRQTTDQDA